MRFAEAWHTEVAAQFSALWAAMTSAAQSIINHLLVDVL
jgi:hypothetical protein